MELRERLVLLIWRSCPLGLTREQASSMAESMLGHDGAYASGLAILNREGIAAVLMSLADMPEDQALRDADTALSYIGYGYPRRPH